VEPPLSCGEAVLMAGDDALRDNGGGPPSITTLLLSPRCDFEPRGGGVVLPFFA